jgi:hypothetical protein
MVEDPTRTVKSRTPIKTLFLYFNLCLKCVVLENPLQRVNGHAAMYVLGSKLRSYGGV